MDGHSGWLVRTRRELREDRRDPRQDVRDLRQDRGELRRDVVRRRGW